jgi:OmcA/MtrC family decaheme c-type cytochrome
MFNKKYLSIMRLGAIALFTAALTACGGGGGGGNGGGGGGGGGALSVNLSPANATASDPNKAFTALSGAPLVTTNSPAQVHFAVIDSNGQPVQGLTLYNAAGAGTGCGTNNVTFAIAKLVNGAPLVTPADPVNARTTDTWQNLISMQRTSGNPGNFIEGTTDPIPSATIPDGTAGAGSLTYNSAGYYTYTFGTDLTDPGYVAGAAISANTIFTNGNTLASDGSTTYRVGIQLCFVDSNGKTVISNPIYDFTMSGGNSSTAPAMRKVVSVAACVQCHGNIGPNTNGNVGVSEHGGRRVDPNYCVLCHNPGSVDYHDNNLTGLINYTTGGDYGAGGAPIDLKYMVHKMHRGELLSQDYQVHGRVARHDTGVQIGAGGSGGTIIEGIQYPQDQRNCTKCHNNSLAANADNWKNAPSRNACGACHDGINFYTGLGVTMDGNADGKNGHVGGAQADDTRCAACHSPTAISGVYHQPITTIVSSGRTTYYASGTDVTRLPANAITVSYDIKSATVAADGTVAVKFCMKRDGTCQPLNATGNLWTGFMGTPSIYVAYSVPQDGITTPADFNAYINNSVLNFRNGTNGSLSAVGAGADLNYYTATFTTKLPNTAPTIAKMVTAAMGYGAMYQTNATGYEATNVPGVAGGDTQCSPTNCTNGLNVSAQDVKMVATNYTARRITAETDRCNACHEKLGIFAESVFHSGQRNDPTMCAMCHNPNRSSSGWSADSTAFIHGIHASQKRTVPYVWHASTDVGGDGITPIRTSAFSTIRLPGGKDHLKNCETCHAPDGYNFVAGAAQVGNRLYRTAATGTMATAGTAGALSLSPYVTAGTAYGSGYNTSNAAATAPAQGTTGSTLVNSPISNACFACHDGDMLSQPGTTAKAHMEWGGGSIYRPRGVAGTTNPTEGLGRAEQCLACHGPNGIEPITAAHQVH